MKVYVASSWKNEQHPEVVKALKRAGHDAYDFKAAETAFRWDAFTPMQLSAPQRFCSEVLPSEMAQKAFVSDMAALRGADATVLVAPCGASAHLELGIAIGTGQLTIVLLDDPIKTPELMWLAADVIVESLDEACEALRPVACTTCREQLASIIVTGELFVCQSCVTIQHPGRRRQTVEPATPRELFLAAYRGKR